MKSKTFIFASISFLCLALNLNLHANTENDIEQPIHEVPVTYANVKTDDHVAPSLVDEREYHFFNDEVFGCDLIKSVISKEDYIFINDNPILRAYFLLIYPASTWLDDESLYILEIL